MINYNIDIENQYNSWDVDIDKYTKITKDILEFYLQQPEISAHCCLNNLEYKTISFDILFCDQNTTHEINKEYRHKDYPADIITFAVFADSPETERFILDFEINLGEVIIALDKIEEEAIKKGISKDTELTFLISHGIMHLLGFDHQTEDEFNFVVKNQKLALKSTGIDYDKI